MKKIVMLLIAAVMLFGVSGQAMASFSQGDLIQVVYQNGGANEVATDFGTASSLGGLTTAYAGSTQTLGTSGVGAFAGVNSSDLQVAYYIVGSNATSFWADGQLAGQTSGAHQQAAPGNMNKTLVKYASIAGTSSQVTLAQTDSMSYYTLGDKNGTAPGVFAGFIPAAGHGEQNLGALATTGYVDSYLYYYPATTITSATAGVQVATLRTYANGQTEIVGSAPVTPIPASILLLGSGLAGLVGIRRKQSA